MSKYTNPNDGYQISHFSILISKYALILSLDKALVKIIGHVRIIWT